MLAALNLVAQTMQSHGKFGTVHAGRILLRLEEAALLKSAGLAVLAFGHIEDDSMSVELWRSIAPVSYTHLDVYKRQAFD